MTVELREFIEARLGEDERIALAVQQRAPWVVVGSYGDEGVKEDGYGWVATGAYNAGMDGDDAAHIARHDPARVLRDVEATRRLLALHAPDVDGDCSTCCGGSELEVLWDGDEETVTEARRPLPSPCPSLLVLALPYSDHPSFDPSWSPESVTGDS